MYEWTDLINIHLLVEENKVHLHTTTVNYITFFYNKDIYVRLSSVPTQSDNLIFNAKITIICITVKTKTKIENWNIKVI